MDETLDWSQYFIDKETETKTRQKKDLPKSYSLSGQSQEYNFCSLHFLWVVNLLEYESYADICFSLQYRLQSNNMSFELQLQRNWYEP